MDFRDINEFFKDAFKYIIIIVIILLVNLYIFGIQQVVGPSMQPTLKEDNLVMVNKLKYKMFKVKREDVIVLKYSGTKYLIKRVIGLPGETIEYKDNILYIDGEEYSEDFLDGVTTDDFTLSDIGYDEIPDDMYLVLGDNRENSMDSRDKSVGLIKKKDIVGKVFWRFWPIIGLKIVK